MALSNLPSADNFKNDHQNLKEDGHERVEIYQEFPDIYQNEDVRDHHDEYLEGPDIHALDGFHDFKNTEESFRNRADTDGVYNTSASQINAILKDPTPFESKKKKRRMSRYDTNDYALADSDDETRSQSSKYSSKDSIDGKPTKTTALKKKRQLRPIYFAVSCLVIVMAGSVSVALFFIIGSRGTRQNIDEMINSTVSFGVRSGLQTTSMDLETTSSHPTFISKDSTTFVTTSQQQDIEDFKKLPGRACYSDETKDMFKSRDEALKKCTPDICGSVWVYSPECNPEKRAYCCDAHDDKYLVRTKGHCVYKKIQNNSC